VALQVQERQEYHTGALVKRVNFFVSKCFGSDHARARHDHARI